MIPQLWGFIRAYRGGFSRSTFKQSLSVLAQDGVLGIFPEGGSWASLLRPARLAYIAMQSQASVVRGITGAEVCWAGQGAGLNSISSGYGATADFCRGQGAAC